MELIDCGISGSDSVTEFPWSELDLAPNWQRIAHLLSGSDSARSIQRKAIHEYSLLQSRRNLIVASTTNSGKTLIGLLMLLDRVAAGGRVLLIEPLRALADEKGTQLREIQAELSEYLGIDFQVVVSTGDYRCHDEMLTDPPPESGQFIIATPERVESIIRNPDNADWLRSITALVLDEAHLITVSKRGMLIENVITTFKMLPSPPRISLLSATLQNVEQFATWLNPCDVIEETVRTPSLKKTIVALPADGDVDGSIVGLVAGILQELANSIIVFVYQTRSAEKLASRLCDEFEPSTAVAYHSRMNASSRKEARCAFVSGQSRVVVTTSALAMGVNLPATHVIVRDLLFAGVGRVPDHEIIQMIGRAGRKSLPGHAFVMARADGPWKLPELTTLLTTEVLQESTGKMWRRGADDSDQIIAISERVASRMSSLGKDRIRIAELEEFFANSLSGRELSGGVGQSVRWLSDSSRLLAHSDEEGAVKLTRLGIQAVQSFFPLPFAAAFALLMRDLLELDEDDQLLPKWSALDHLILLELLASLSPSGLRFSEPLADNVDGWVEQSPQKPMLYVNWLRGKTGDKACELLGSLGMSVDEKQARQIGYKAVANSIVIYERGLGRSVTDLSRRWKCTDLAAIEEKWRDQLIWLLGAYAGVLDRRVFYYHLEATLKASQQRIDRVSQILKQMQFQVYALQDHVKYCSPLGGILRSLKRTAKGKGGIGIQSIRKLEAAGITDLATLATMKTDDLKAFGLRKNAADAMIRYIQRRSQ